MQSKVLMSATFVMIGSISPLLACSKPQEVNEAEIPGRYAMRFRGSTDSLELKADGLYRHRLWDAGVLAFDETGNWTFALKDGDPAVELSNFSSVSDLPAPHRPRPGWWISPVGRDRDAQVYILVTRDIGLKYKRLR